jgi:hypothetical protein
MLLLPITTRVNFCAMYFISFVTLEQLNMPTDLVCVSPPGDREPGGRAVKGLVPRSRP